jgi:type IV pilus assembly protein PilP
MKTLLRLTFFIAQICLLASCGSSNEEELRVWMSEQRTQMRPKVKPVAEPKKFLPETYTQAALVDPFSREKLTLALKRDSMRPSTTSALLAPELARRKEALEAFPLDTMSMVGSLVKEGRPAALVKVEKLLYQIKVGSYLGLNYGRVLKISETEVVLREIVQDAAGEWIERSSTLQLQEGSK